MRRKAVKALVMHTKDSIRHLKDDDDEMLRGQISMSLSLRHDRHLLACPVSWLACPVPWLACQSHGLQSHSLFAVVSPLLLHGSMAISSEALCKLYIIVCCSWSWSFLGVYLMFRLDSVPHGLIFEVLECIACISEGCSAV